MRVRRGPDGARPDVQAVDRHGVEGGGRTHAGFIGGGLADELHLVVAPLLVGDPCAPRWLGEGGLPPTPRGAPSLAGVRQMGDLVLLRYRWPAP